MEVPVMLSFGNAGGSNMSSLTVKISATKSGGFDKFSLRNSVSLVLRVLKTDVLWIVFQKSAKNQTK